MTRPTSPAEGYSVDLARAPDAIRKLEQAKAELQRIRDDALLLGNVQPPARDAVSIDAAKALSDAAVGGPSSFVTAMEAGISHLQALIDDLGDELAAYRSSEDAARSSIAAVDRA